MRDVCPTSGLSTILLEFLSRTPVTSALPLSLIFPYHVPHRRGAAASCPPASALVLTTQPRSSTPTTELQPSMTPAQVGNFVGSTFSCAQCSQRRITLLPRNFKYH